MRIARIVAKRLTLLLVMAPCAAAAEDAVKIDPIVVTAPGLTGDSSDASLGATVLGGAARRNFTGDSARLLQDIPGVSLYGAGGISSIPAIHGLADDRIDIRVDGAELTSACPNHMNSPLSYSNPAEVSEVTVFSGVAPVSVGGDNIAGSIQVKSAPPKFTGPGETPRLSGEAGSYFRSNGNAFGYHFGATLAGRLAQLSYRESDSQSDDYKAAGGFKPVGQGREGGPLLPGDQVGSSAYHGATNRELGLSLGTGGQLLQLTLSRQTVGFEGFPNQRMDMTDNDNRLFKLRYTGEFEWGDLEARLSYQDTRHRMDMGPDRFFYGTGMPMLTKAKTLGGAFKGNVFLSEKDLIRSGVEFQNYTLYDWWPPVGGSMGPNAFWNVDYGQRNKIDAFVEWERRWQPQWLSIVGVRSDTVLSDAAPVQGYDNGLAGWGTDAASFNAHGRRRNDYNVDLSALLRYTPDATLSYEGGYSRKSRSPSLYQRYPWSTNAMAALMNNFAGDGNGYLGNVELRPEVANTISVSGDWHDGAKESWGVKATAYVSYVEDYIDTRRCDFGQCSAANTGATSGFVLLEYVNQSAELHGLDLSGQALLRKGDPWGSLTGTGLLNYVRGRNLTTGDNLYNIMPLNAKLALVHRLGSWSSTAELQGVAGKREVSRVRNEVPTGGYWLAHLRTSYEWQHARLDLGIENLFNRFYSLPLGGAYLGQGSSMTTTGIPWGVPVPGPGRSIDVALNLRF